VQPALSLERLEVNEQTENDAVLFCCCC